MFFLPFFSYRYFLFDSFLKISFLLIFLLYLCLLLLYRLLFISSVFSLCGSFPSLLNWILSSSCFLMKAVKLPCKYSLTNLSLIYFFNLKYIYTFIWNIFSLFLKKNYRSKGFVFWVLKFKYFKNETLFLHFFLIELHHGQRVVFVNPWSHGDFLLWSCKRFFGGI